MLFQEEKDAPSGGIRTASTPMWNPFQYFLIVMEARIRQARKEWENIVLITEERLSDDVRLKYPNVLTKPPKNTPSHCIGLPFSRR